jgi:hypothetical protein
VTAGLILDELELDLSSAGFLVRLGFLLFVIVFDGAVNGVVVLDEAVFGDGRLRLWLTGLLLLLCGGSSSGWWLLRVR